MYDDSKKSLHPLECLHIDDLKKQKRNHRSTCFGNDRKHSNKNNDGY